jgi:Tfp pilus assembly protein PilO
MDLSKREKGLMYGSLGVLAILAIDYYALTPLMEQQDLLNVQRDQILSEMERDRKLFAERKQLAPKWKTLLSDGLKGDPAEAEGQLLHGLRNWANETGLTLSSVKPDRPESKEQLKQIYIQASGTGSMDSIAKFLYKMQSAGIPLKVTELQIGARNEGDSNLAMQFKVSTLYRSSEQAVAKIEKTGNGGSVK